MVSMPIKNPSTRPSDMEGQVNGRVSPDLLTWVEPERTALVWLMHHLPARSMRALIAHAKRDGINLTSTGRGRTYLQQVSLFQSRYQTTPIPYEYDDETGKPVYETKVWNGVVWYQKPGTSMAAIPGTSNHGWWLADDLAEIIDGVVKPLRPSTVVWLFTNVPAYGFHWETIKENWHVHWTNGDRVTQATLDYEASLTNPLPPPTPPSESYDEYMSVLYRVKGDIAVFVATGLTMTWVPDEGSLNFLKFLRHVDPTKDPVEINRDILGSFYLIGPAPTYPGGYNAGRTTLADFRGAA
jgi:hypothetical protein